MKHITCYECFPPRSGKHYFLAGKPIHTRTDCPPNTIYFLNKSDMKPLKKHPKQQRMEEMTFPIIKPGKKTKEMRRWDKALEESREGLEKQRCKSCGVYPGSSHTDRCESLLEIRKRAWKEYIRTHSEDLKGNYTVKDGVCTVKIKDVSPGEHKVVWEGREYLRSINDDNGFRLMPRLVWRVVAVVILVIICLVIIL